VIRHRNEPLVVGATAEATEDVEIPQSPSASKAWSHSGRIDFSRLDSSLQVLFGATLVLFFALLLPWYTFRVVGPRGGIATGSASAMEVGGWRYLIWSLVLLTIVFLFLESVTSFKRPSWLKRYEVLLGVTIADVVLVLVAALATRSAPPHPQGLPVPDAALQTSVGAWIALAAAVAALGAAIAGTGDHGRLRVGGLRVQSPVTGLRSPFVRSAPGVASGTGAVVAGTAIAGAIGAPFDTAVEAPVEPRVVTPGEAAIEAPVEAPPEATEPQVEALVEAPPVEPAVEMPVEASGEAPPVEPAVDAPVEALADAPVEPDLEESVAPAPAAPVEVGGATAAATTAVVGWRRWLRPSRGAPEAAEREDSEAGAFEADMAEADVAEPELAEDAREPLASEAAVADAATTTEPEAVGVEAAVAEQPADVEPAEAGAALAGAGAWYAWQGRHDHGELATVGAGSTDSEARAEMPEQATAVEAPAGAEDAPAPVDEGAYAAVGGAPAAAAEATPSAASKLKERFAKVGPRLAAAAAGIKRMFGVVEEPYPAYDEGPDGEHAAYEAQPEYTEAIPVTGTDYPAAVDHGADRGQYTPIEDWSAEWPDFSGHAGEIHDDEDVQAGDHEAPENAADTSGAPQFHWEAPSLPPAPPL
jgi:hypothetical protein